MVNKVCLRVLMYTLEGRLKECEKMFLIAIFCISDYETQVLNVICLLNEVYYILGKYVEVICNEATGKKQNQTELSASP